MTFLATERFTFASKGLPEDTFGVVNFKGVEGLSRCYAFEIGLVSDQADLPLKQVMSRPAVFTIKRSDGDIPFHGIISQFEQLHSFKGYVFFRAVLVPKLSWLEITHHNQVFLDRTVPQVLAAVLEDGGLTGLDYELRLSKEYPVWEYVCQYRESHLAFLNRWMEREGMYYYFEQTPQGEKVVITDTKIAHTAMPEGKVLTFSPPSGLEADNREEVVRRLTVRCELVPQSVRMKDYHYLTPSLEVTGSADASPEGRGETYLYGDNLRSPEEGKALAQIRAEEYQCREDRYLGESTVPFLRPGYIFSVQDHYREDCNRTYLTIEIEHDGNQAGYLVSGIQESLAEGEKEQHYKNRFTTIPSSVQFRAPRVTQKARIYGTLSARIDAAGSGKYAEVDNQGRYKIVLPFDLSGRQGGKASAFVRMMQPYTGADHGMHFPLHKGTEVLLTFIDGDPDRPVIAGAVPNPEHPSVIRDSNQTMAAITTSGQNKIHIEDQEGKQRILVQSPTANSWIRVGAPNDSIDADTNALNGIRIRTSENLWLEAKDLFGEYTVGVPSDGEIPSGLVDMVHKVYRYGDDDYQPTGVELFSGEEFPESASSDKLKWQYLMENGKVRLYNGDSFFLENGNIYDLGGYWNYNLGSNCYIESHIDISPKLNEKHEKFWPEAEEEGEGLEGQSPGEYAGGTAAVGIGTALSVFGTCCGAVVAACVGSIGGGIIAVVVGMTTPLLVTTSIGALAESAEFQGNVGDCIEGPNSGKIETWAKKVKSSFSDPSHASVENQNFGSSNSPMHTDSTVVTKSFRDVYNFTGGNTINITIGNTEQHTRGDIYEYKYGGLRESTNFNAEGDMVSWEKSSHGIKEAAQWDDITGTLLSYEYENKGHFTYEGTFPTFPRLKIETSVSSLDAALDVKMGMKIEAGVSLGLALEVEAAASLSASFKVKRGGEFEYDEVTREIEFKSFGLEAQKKAAIKAELEDLLMKKAGLDMKSKTLNLDSTLTKIEEGEIGVESGFKFTGL
jgi:type VI secretion system VgrG family protein